MRVEKSNRFSAFIIMCVLVNILVTIVINQINYHLISEDLYEEYESIQTAVDELSNQITRVSNTITDHQEEIESQITEVESEVEPEAYTLTDEEINLIAQLTMAEAGNQPVLGQRLVIDTVLNRVDHPNFPDTVEDVIYQKYQFSPVWDGRLNDCYPREDLIALVKEELERRTDTEVVFFRAYEYGPYGVPLYKIGDHYFSKYE